MFTQARGRRWKRLCHSRWEIDLGKVWAVGGRTCRRGDAGCISLAYGPGEKKVRKHCAMSTVMFGTGYQSMECFSTLNAFGNFVAPY